MVEARRRAVAEWASEGEPKSVGEPELTLRYKRPVCDSIRKEGAQASSRVAPQEFYPSCPSSSYCRDRRVFVFPECPAKTSVQIQRKVDKNMSQEIPYKIYLSESEMPTAWYNLRADMKNKPAPLLNPGTGKPMGFDDLRGVFCDELVRQELDRKSVV